MKRSLTRRVLVIVAGAMLGLSAMPAGAIKNPDTNGTPGSQINMTFLAALSYPQQTDPVRNLCGGVLVRRATVLTAAHCRQSMFPDNHLQARIGSKRRTGDGIQVMTMRLVVHPTLDLMLVRLATPVSYEPVAIRETEAPVGTEVVIAGWGGPLQGNDYPLEFSRATTDLVAPVGVCQSGWTGFDVCVNNRGGKGPCQGDDGGPVIERDATPGGKHLLVGIIRTVECGDQPSIAVSAPKLRAWIDANAG